MPSVKATEIKIGMTITFMHDNRRFTVTHVRKHRTYKGFYAVQGRFEGSSEVTQANLFHSELVSVIS